MTLSGHIIDFDNKIFFKGELEIDGDKILRINARDVVDEVYIVPGFIDAHVHIESSMLVPSEFARMAVVHGTVATISDPHEIANVLGVEGVHYMIDNGKQIPFKFYFGAPSCVPATAFETAGAEVSVCDVETLLKSDDIIYLAEMMNWPGVLAGDEQVTSKITIAKQLGKVIDGHAPGLKGDQATRYAQAGMSTDHECFTFDEALDKIKAGMKVIIREGSAAKNFDALIPLIKDYPDSIMFCSDDKHPDSLEEGHINDLVRRAVEGGYDLFDALKAACINPIEHYGLKVGRLRVGDPADFVVLEDLKSFKVHKTFINGTLVASNGVSRIDRVSTAIVNNFSASPKTPSDFAIKAESDKIKVIEVQDGQLITENITFPAKIVSGFAVSDVEHDILKVTVINRYHHAKPAIAFVKNVGLKEGAIASSVAHDSHNIICVGVDDDAIAEAVNLIIETKGGIAAVSKREKMIIPLPIAGLMTNEDGYLVSSRYKEIDQLARAMGSTLKSPFMSISFLALLVIPSLKLSDKGLFDGEKFTFTSLFA
jgi:adenine deaminase